MTLYSNTTRFELVKKTTQVFHFKPLSHMFFLLNNKFELLFIDYKTIVLPIKLNQLLKLY